MWYIFYPLCLAKQVTSQLVRITDQLIKILYTGHKTLNSKSFVHSMKTDHVSFAQASRYEPIDIPRSARKVACVCSAHNVWSLNSFQEPRVAVVWVKSWKAEDSGSEIGDGSPTSWCTIGWPVATWAPFTHWLMPLPISLLIGLFRSYAQNRGRSLNPQNSKDCSRHVNSHGLIRKYPTNRHRSYAHRDNEHITK